MKTLKLFRLVLLTALLVSLSILPVSATASSYPAQGRLVWETWLNENVDVVNPAQNTCCWDTPTFRYENVDYFGYRSCFRMIEREPGQWWLEEWRGTISVPLSIERMDDIATLRC